MNHADKGRFYDYVADCGRPLVRTAYLLTDSWDEAEALLEHGLTMTYLRWRSVEDSDPAGHTLTSLARDYIRRARPARPGRPSRRRGPETGPAVESSSVWSAVQALPAHDRLAVTLRIFNRLSTEQIAGALRMTEAKAEAALVDAADRIRDALKGEEATTHRTLESVLADEMDRRVASLPLAPSRFALVERRARRTSRLRLAAVLVTLAVVLPLAVWGISALLPSDGQQSAAAAPASSATGPSTTGPGRSEKPARSPSATPIGRTSPKSPSAAIAVPLIVGRRIVTVSRGKTRTVATLDADGSGDDRNLTVLRAGASFVVRAGEVRRPTALKVVREDGEVTSLAASTGSVAVDAEGTRVAYTKVAADGKAVQLVLADLPDGTHPTTIDTPLASTVVRGFVGDAVLLSYVDLQGDEVARRWNPVAGQFTDLDGRYGEVHAVHAEKKLALLEEKGKECAVVAFIEFGVLHPRGRDCARDLSSGDISPDGTRLAFAGRAGTGIIVATLAEGLPAVANIPIEAGVRDLIWESSGTLVVLTGDSDGTEATVLRCDTRARECKGIRSPGTAPVQLVH